MYRFRSVENLIGEHQELEKQEIYFASPKELNDPIEGYKDVFWKGDRIVWENFIKNYVRSLEDIVGIYIFIGFNTRLTINDIKHPYHITDFNIYRNFNIASEIIDELWKIKVIYELVISLSIRTKPIRRDELLMYLKIIHPIILKVISDIYLKKELISKELLEIDLSELCRNLDVLNKVFKQLGNYEAINKSIFNGINNAIQSIIIKRRAETDEKTASYMENYDLIFTNFPKIFLDKLESDIFPDWYSASFISEYSKNSAVWSHYGNEHTGICLKFRTEQTEEGKIITLRNEFEPNTIGNKQLHFRKIKYKKTDTEIDFFRSLAKQPKFKLNRYWYTDENNNMSSCAEHFINSASEDEWTESYWDKFFDSCTAKLNDWEYEHEYRLIVHGWLSDYSSQESRKLKYDFNDLEEITFGMNTLETDKMKIIKIIRQKCIQYNRSDFSFYQAYYSKDTGTIERHPISNLMNEN